MSTGLGDKKKQHLIVAGLMGLVALLWTVAEILPTLLTPGYSLYQVVWMRYGTHILVMLLALAPRHGRALFRTGKPALQIGRGLLMLVMPASYIASLGHARGLDVLAVFWLSPLLMLGFAAVIHGDRPPWYQWGAAAAAFLGAQLVLRPSADVANAALFGLGMGGSFSLYVVLTRSLRSERTAANLLYSAIVVFVPVTFVIPTIWLPMTPLDAALMIGVGIAGLGVLWAIDRASELAPISAFAVFFPLQLVIIAIVLPSLTGMRPARLALVGTALIVGSALAGWLLSTRSAGAGAEPIEAIAQVNSP